MATESRAMHVFAANVRREIAARADLNQARLARRAGISRTLLVNMLNGRMGCTVTTAERIAEALGTDLSRLFSARTRRQSPRSGG